MSLQIMTLVWGDKHLEMFKKTCLASFAYPKNRGALRSAGSTWNIFTEEKYYDQISNMVSEALPAVEIELKSISSLRTYIDNCQSALVMMVEKCIASGDKFLMAPPDTIFGDGTIGNMIKLCRDKGAAIAVPHPRVLPAILEEMAGPLSNQELVALAWKHLHKSWTDAEVGHHTQNSFVGGVDWQYLDDNTISVLHRLPTVYMADFAPEDLQYFKLCISFGSFDHEWPAELVKIRRQKFVGSSDACFIVEITEKDKNVPPIWPGDPNKFWQKHLHNELNAEVAAIFRR
jgi:hypothetical protein